MSYIIHGFAAIPVCLLRFHVCTCRQYQKQSMFCGASMVWGCTHVGCLTVYYRAYMITVSGVTKRFGSVRAVEAVSFTVGDGEIVGLLGPNGAGKTTTMRIMAGFYAPDEGDVILDNVSVAAEPVLARRLVGYLPESNPLYGDMLVVEYLTFMARLKDVPRREYRSVFDRIVTDTGIDEVFYRPVGELSKGFRQRVGLAGALMGDPAILILDEPTEGLDPNQRADIRTLLTKLATHKTVLVSSHVISEIQAIARRVVVLKNGTVAVDGMVDELIAAHGAESRFSVELEGKGVQEAVAALPSVLHAVPVRSVGERVEFIVTVRDATRMPPELSKLVGARGYTLWRLAPEQGGLERVFADLTRETETSAAVNASSPAGSHDQTEPLPTSPITP